MTDKGVGMRMEVLIGFCAVTLASIIVVVVPTITVSAQPSDRAIEVKSSADVAAAASVNKALDVLVAQAAACKTPGTACACSLKPGLGRLSAAYHRAINRHPNWKEAAVQYVMQSNGRSITTAVVFPNIRRQLDICHVF